MPVTTPAATYTTYPIKDDVGAVMTGGGITVPATLDLDYYLYAAIDEWEQGTRCVPFLAASSTTTYKYDPPGPNIRYTTRGGGRKLLLSRPMFTVTEVRTAITSTDAVGNLLTLDVDYFLMPRNAEDHYSPITWIEFATQQRGYINSVTVKGKPGWSDHIRADAWTAIRDLAASLATLVLKEGQASNPIEWKEDDVMERSSIELLQKLGDSWGDHARRVMRRYVFMQ